MASHIPTDGLINEGFIQFQKSGVGDLLWS